MLSHGSNRAFDLTDEQTHFVELALNGKNMWAKGVAGTGKTVSLRAVRTRLTALSKKCVSLAPTNAAATNIEGLTFHAGMGIPVLNPETKMEFVYAIANQMERSRLPKFKRHFQGVDVVIVDEVALVSMFMFDCLDAILRIVKNNGKEFGGVQLLVFGDDHQLKAVRTRSCIHTPKFERIFHEFTVEFTEVKRQNNPEFVAFLSRVRANTATDDDVKLIESRRKAFSEAKIDGKLPEDLVYLFPTNAQVDEMHRECLEALPGNSVVFKVKEQIMSTGMQEMTRPGWKRPNNARDVELKKDLVVRCTIPGKQFRGVVVDFGKDVVHVREFTTNTMKQVRLEIVVFKSYARDGKVYPQITVSFMPLEPLGAITIQRCQGLEAMNVAVPVDRSIFLANQVYTAMTRLRGIEGLWICGGKVRRGSLVTSSSV